MFYGPRRAEPRDLSVEIEGDGMEASDRDRRLIRDLAWTALSVASKVEEASDTFGLSGGNKKKVEVSVFFLVSPSSTSPPPLRAQGLVDCPDLSLHQ